MYTGLLGWGRDLSPPTGEFTETVSGQTAQKAADPAPPHSAEEPISHIHLPETSWLKHHEIMPTSLPLNSSKESSTTKLGENKMITKINRTSPQSRSLGHKCYLLYQLTRQAGDTQHTPIFSSRFSFSLCKWDGPRCERDEENNNCRCSRANN